MASYKPRGFALLIVLLLASALLVLAFRATQVNAVLIGPLGLDIAGDNSLLKDRQATVSHGPSSVRTIEQDEPEASMIIRVYLPSGFPGGGVVVWNRGVSPAHQIGVTDGDGILACPPQDSASFQIQAVGERGVSSARHVLFETSKQVDLVLQYPATISGVVLGPLGDPVGAGVGVFALAMDEHFGWEACAD